jgi:cardiolipin synthase
MHSKLFIVDDMLSSTGSTNIDFRSFEQNFEVNAFIYDTDIAIRFRTLFLRDQSNCSSTRLKLWQRRPLRLKVAESIMRLLAPLL